MRSFLQPLVMLISIGTIAMTMTCVVAPATAELHVHRIFDNNMVLQRDKPVKVWGRADANTRVSVQFGQQQKDTQSGDDGSWAIVLEPMPASSEGRVLKVMAAADPTDATDAVAFENVLVGDVWLCGGQSNMELSLERIYQGDIEIASARHAQVRLMTIPVGATPERQTDFERLNEFNSWTRQHENKGSWLLCSPDTAKMYAALGYIFGRRLHLASGVPIGLIDNSVGGTTVEGWTSRESLEKIPAAAGLLQDWDTRIAAWNSEQDLADRIQRWEQDNERRRERGEKPNTNPKPDDLRPGPAFDRNNPGASYNAMLASLAGFRIKGAIFHQGYNNALGDSRPNLYAQTFQAMIADWRAAFDDDELPFGIIELCAGAEPQTLDNFEVRMIDAGPYIREAQFQAYRDLKNIGWASAYDVQVNWYHPHAKTLLAERLARWALGTQYDMPFGHEPAQVVDSSNVSSSPEGDRIVITLDREVTVVDGRPIAGMAIAGDDQRFYPAQARFAVKKKDDRGREILDFARIEVWSPLVKAPTAVRYAWARCPLGNLTNRDHMQKIIPVPSFRTDNWQRPDAPFGDDKGETRRRNNDAKKKAEADAKDRRLREAQLIVEELQTTDQ